MRGGARRQPAMAHFLRAGSLPLSSSSRNRRTHRSGSALPAFFTLKRSPPSAPGTRVVRHREGLCDSSWRNSSVAQICPGSTCGSTRATHRTASPPAMTAAQVAIALVRLHLAVVQRDAQAGPARRLIDIVHDLPRHLGERHRIGVDDHDGIAIPGLDDLRPVAPLLHGVFQRLAHGGVRSRPHQRAEPLDVGLQDTQHVDADGAVGALGLPPGPAVARDVHPVDPLQIARVDPADHVRQDGVHQVACGTRQHAIGLERRFAGPQKPLHRCSADPVVVNVADQPRPVHRAEDVLVIRRARLGTVLLEETPPPRGGSGRARAGGAGTARDRGRRCEERSPPGTRGRSRWRHGSPLP